ncbi:MAG: cache domain-containing protein [Candidatus Scalindua sp.]|nr:cache domain-containing protein [Candidatus Scalindua sp.]
MKPIKKISLSYAVAFFVFLLFFPLFSYKAFKSAIKDEAFNHLITARELLKHQIIGYFRERFGDVDILAKNPIIKQALVQLSESFYTFGINSSQYNKTLNRYQSLMEHYVKSHGYINIFLVNRDGDVIFSVTRENFTGTNVLTGKYQDFSFAQVFRNGLEEAAFEDYTWNNTRGEFRSYFSAPVYDSQSLSGVLVIEIPFSHLDAMLTHRAGLGETGEMYLVGEDEFMRSNSRFSEEPTILQQEVDTEAAQDAFEGNTGTMITADYRGVVVLSAYTPLNLKFVNWVLLAEIDEKEALRSINTIERRLIIFTLVIFAVTTLYLYIIFKREKNNTTAESKHRITGQGG